MTPEEQFKEIMKIFDFFLSKMPKKKPFISTSTWYAMRNWQFDNLSMRGGRAIHTNQLKFEKNFPNNELYLIANNQKICPN